MPISYLLSHVTLSCHIHEKILFHRNPPNSCWIPVDSSVLHPEFLVSDRNMWGSVTFWRKCSMRCWLVLMLYMRVFHWSPFLLQYSQGCRTYWDSIFSRPAFESHSSGFVWKPLLTWHISRQAQVLRENNISDVHRQYLSIAVNVLAAASDLLIAGILCILLHRSRTGFQRWCARFAEFLKSIHFDQVQYHDQQARQ